MSTDTKESFSKYRKIFFPIYKHEIVKFVPLLLLFSLVSFNYNILRSLKDMFFMNYTGSAEVLPFIKTYLVTPSMIALIYGYVKISKRLNVYKRFNIVILYFLVTICACYYLFIPNMNSLQLDSLADTLEKYMPSMKHLWGAIRYWPLSLLYIHGEAWGSIVLGVAFWTLANETTTFNAAQRTYSYLASTGSAVGSISAGLVLKNALTEDFNKGLLIVIIAIVFTSIIYNIMLRKVVHMRSSCNPVVNTIQKKSKKKLSFWKSLRVLAQSKHLALIAAIVLSYNLFINLFETLWKDQVAQYGRALGNGALAAVYGDQSMYIGIMVIVFGILAPYIKNKGWKITASITPVIAILATTAFCVFLYAHEFFVSFFKNAESSTHFTLKLSVAFGLLNIVFIKASKYVLFDSTKEQAYIPISEEEKVEGKAAIDGVGSRLGKSLGGVIMSWPHIGLIHLFGSIYNAKFYICAVIFIILFVWLKSIKQLDLSILSKKVDS
jgi:AAA family ATP:ADP antiporter